MRIGVFGGTFDPIHLGHLAAATATREALGLARVIFVPAGEPWLKAAVPISPSHDRLEMVRLALVDERGFEISTAEIDRPGPSYTVDTIETLRRQLREEAELYLLIGSDVLWDVPRWKEPSRLIQMCRVAAFTRPGAPLPGLDALEGLVPGISKHITPVQVPQMDISATEIRRLVAKGAPIGHLVPAAVERYIVNHGLYGTPGE